MKISCSIAVTALWLGVSMSLQAAPPAGKVAGDSAAVERVLRGEALAAVDRRAQLEGALNVGRPAATTRWQAGFVKDGEAWRPFENIEQSAALQAKIAEYERRRAAASATSAGQLELANWCKQSGLPERERAHLFAVLGVDPEGKHDDVLVRLGFAQIGSTWLSREQLLEWQELNRKTETSLKKYSARLERLADQLSDGQGEKTSTMLALRKLAEPAAIPAIEYTLCSRNEACALAAVDILSRLTDPEATTALAKLGVFSEWAPVRQAAAKALKPRRPEDFAPQLIALLSTPIRWEFRFYETPTPVFFGGNVKLFCSYVLSRETEDQYQSATFNTINYMINRAVAGAIVRGEHFRATRGQNGIDGALNAGRSLTYAEIAADLNARDRTLARFNERTNELNGRIGSVLAVVSDQPDSTDAKTWWSWWNATADLERSGKRVAKVDDYETVGNPEWRFTIISCFTEGTPVWTDTGIRPIEQIRVGDLVLAKDIETGELAYKPVLQTTVRPPKELVTLRLDDETIVCTGGHRFWESGTGWVKARDIGSASLMHTARGSTPVWMATKGETAETFNLVVADFHTYFVGKNAVLCQDLLIPRPTNKVVPGFDRSLTVAENR